MNEPRLSELSAVQKEAAKQKAQRILERTEGTSCNNRRDGYMLESKGLAIPE